VSILFDHPVLFQHSHPSFLFAREVHSLRQLLVRAKLSCSVLRPQFSRLLLFPISQPRFAPFNNENRILTGTDWKSSFSHPLKSAVNAAVAQPPPPPPDKLGQATLPPSGLSKAMRTPLERSCGPRRDPYNTKQVRGACLFSLHASRLAAPLIAHRPMYHEAWHPLPLFDAQSASYP